MIAWLERKATQKSNLKAPVKLKQVCQLRTSRLAHNLMRTQTRVIDDALMITIPHEYLAVLMRLDGYEFAGVNLSITRSSASADPQTNELQAMFKRLLDRRFKADAKLLDLSVLAEDVDLKGSAIFGSKTTTEKFFAAMLKVLQDSFPSEAHCMRAVQSVSLANNGLPNVAPVSAIAQYLPELRNLDLSSNAIASSSALEAWRHKFTKLDHLVISNNPLEVAEPDYAQTLIKWYPRLRNLNGIQVRSDQDVAQASKLSNLPFPIRAPNFQDEGQIAENFVRTFFTGYDSDRPALARMYYDDQSDFSFALNTSAPREAATTTPAGEWAAYIKGSRNLKKITHVTARQSRHHRGTAAISECWNSLPATRHPDLADASKWLIECQIQPGLPDPSGAAAGGVDGFLLLVHGEFDETITNAGVQPTKRSFDRTIVIGPGGPSGVRVVNDMLVIRAYGGSQAYTADSQIVKQAEVHQPAATTAGAATASLPAGLTIEAAQQLVLELQAQTNMTTEYAKDCLEQVQWDPSRAMQAFAAVRASLPPTAFVITG